MAKTGSIYKLVILAARRALELNEGAAKLIDVKIDVKTSTVALREIAEGRITFKVKEPK